MSKIVVVKESYDSTYCPAERIAGPKDIVALMAPKISNLDQEEFWVISLNQAGNVKACEMVSRGGLASSIVEPRGVFLRAVHNNAAAIVCAHNHPSGNPEPSADDVAVTRQLVEAGRILGIPVRDHVIIAGNGWTSLAERGAV